VQPPVYRSSAFSLRGHDRHGARDGYGAVGPMLDWGHMMAGHESWVDRVEVPFGRPVEPVNGAAKEAGA